MKILVGLGNPGRQYEDTRHNAGFRVIDELARRAALSFSSTKFGGEFTQGSIKGEKVVLLKPMTFMNLSGDSVVPAARFFKVEAQDLVVIHDELDLPLGRIQLRIGGGTGGHNGLESIVGKLGSGDFVRVRIGIGKPVTKERVVGHVLGGFSKEEATLLNEVVKRSASAVETLISDGLDRAMNDFNRR